MSISLCDTMPDDIATLVRIDFKNFKLSRLQDGSYNELYMTREQHRILINVLAESKPDIDKLIVLYSEPDQSDMEMMGVKREEVGYRSIEVMVKIDKITNLPSDWTYNLIFLTKEEDGNPGMAFGDIFYTRDEVKNLTASNKK